MVHYNDLQMINLQFILIREWSLNNINIIFSLLFIGLTGVIAFLCIFQAYRIGSPPSVAPFEYILIVLVFNIKLDYLEGNIKFKGFIGLGFIVFAGILYIY